MSGTDERFERALGDPPSPPAEELDAFVRDVREAFPERPMLAEGAHLAAIADAARRISPETPPVNGKERPVRFPRIRSRAAMVVAGLVVVMSSFGGLAFAGALPGGVQDGVANAAATLGMNLPGGDEESAVELEDDATESEAPEPTETEAPEPGDQGDNEHGDEQGDNEQGDDQGHDQESDANDRGGDNESEGSGDQQESGSNDQGGDNESDGAGGGGGNESGDDSGDGGGDRGD